MEALKLNNFSFKYPGEEKNALDTVSLTVNQGEFVTVCGKSGCGKSTLLRHLKPLLSPHGEKSGETYFEGRPLDSLNQREQCEKIGYVLQSPDNQIVTDKVWHELAFGLESLGYNSNEIRARVAEMASFFGIQGWFHRSVSELSGGQKQLLNLASVMVVQPSLLILDEPTSQLDPTRAQEFLETLSKINRELGTTIILSEHRLEECFALSDRIIVMDEGKIISDDAPSKTGENLKALNHDMLLAMPTAMRVFSAVRYEKKSPVTVREGRAALLETLKDKEIKPRADKPAEAEGKKEPLIDLKDVWFRYEKNLPDVIRSLSCKIYKGQLYAIVGGNGTGKTTALSLLSAIRSPQRGKVKIEGKSADKYKGRISLLPQNPQALFLKKTVGEDLADTLLYTNISNEEKQGRIDSAVKLCELENLLSRHPNDISGGEQQRLALAKILLLKPDIILLDEPTKGLDSHFKKKLAGVLDELKADGITIVMVSHDIEFCAEYADMCAMFFDGGIISEDEPRKFFSGKRFYTTAANRMARDIIPGAVLAEDIINTISEVIENG